MSRFAFSHILGARTGGTVTGVTFYGG